MSIKVTVNSSSPYRVSVNSQQPKNVRLTGTNGGSSATRLEYLTDVDASDPDNNETLVYDSVSGKYVIKTLPTVDGGTF
jgi:hypothetical protein